MLYGHQVTLSVVLAWIKKQLKGMLHIKYRAGFRSTSYEAVAGLSEEEIKNFKEVNRIKKNG